LQLALLILLNKTGNPANCRVFIASRQHYWIAALERVL
jgi:hypothetical protein